MSAETPQWVLEIHTALKTQSHEARAALQAVWDYTKPAPPPKAPKPR